MSYAYDGLNNRVSQTISSTITQYLLDLQPGLSVVLAAATGADTDRYIHGPRGIHAQRDAADNWEWMVQDGLGSVRGVADNTGAVQWSGSYGPYGNDFGDVGTPQTMYGFTGEPTNETGLVHLRARDYNPALGIFTALDLFEGMAQRPMSLNGYSWVEGNVPNAGDPSGMQCVDNNICEQLRSIPKAYIAAGCRSIAGTCCGPDATEWLYGEMVNHYRYISSLFPVIDPSTQWLEKILRSLTGFYAGFDMGILMLYGLAVDYKRVDYQVMAIADSMIAGRPSRVYGDYSCTNTRVVTVCGQCQDASDYGNFFIGLGLSAAGEARASATSAGLIFNLASHDLEGLPIDTRGVEVGYDVASSSMIRNGVSFNRDEFCNLLNSHTGWLDRRGMSGGNGTMSVSLGCHIPCSECYSNVNQSPHSIPDYNGYVSTTIIGGLHSREYARPVDELLALFSRSLGSDPVRG